jgi:hypothetical protein
MSEIEKYKKYLNFKANPRYLRRDFMVPLYTGTEPDIVPEASIEQQGMIVDPSKILPKNFTDDMPFVTDQNNPKELELADGGSVERQGFKFGTRQELIDKMSKAGFDKYPSYLQEPHKLAKAYNIKTKISPGYKTRYSYDIPSDKKLSSILETLESNRTNPRSGSFKKSQEILNNPKLKKEFIKFGSQQGVTGKQIREKYKISTAEFFQGGLRDLFDKNFQTDYRASVLPQTIERMKKILNNKKFNKLLNDGFLPKHKDLKKIFKFTPHEASTAVFRIGQAFTGQKFENIENLNIPKNKKAGKELLDEISKAPFNNPYSSAARTAVLDKIDSQMGNKVGSFDSFRKTIINNIKDNGLNKKLLKNFDLNEIAGVSATSKNKMAPYAYFVNLVDSKVNQRELASFNNLYGRKTNELIDSVSQFKKTGDDTKVKEVLNSFEESKNNFLNNVRPKVRKEIERVGLPGLSINSPEIEFGKRRINQLSKLGLNLPESFEKTGVTMTVPKGSVTLQDLKTNSEALKKFIGSIGCPTYAVGGRVNFSEGSDCYNKGLKKLEEGNLSKAELNVARSTITTAGEEGSFLKNILDKAGSGIKFTGVTFDDLMAFGRTPGGRLLGYGVGVGLPAYFAGEELLKGNIKQAGRELGYIPTLGFGLPESLVGSVKTDLIGHAKEKGFNVGSIEKILNKNEISKKINAAEELLGYGKEANLKNPEKFNKPIQDKIKSLYEEYDSIKLNNADQENLNKTLESFYTQNRERVPELFQARTKILENIQKDIGSFKRSELDPAFAQEEKINIPLEKIEEPVETVPEELPSEYKVSAAEGGYIDYMRDYNRYASGGRIHLNEGGGGPKLSRRGFLGFLAGAAASPFVIKAMKGKKLLSGAKVATKVLPKVSGMPDWFNPLVTRIMNEGVDISPKAERVEDIVKVKKLEFPMPEEGTTKFRKSGSGFEKKNIETITMTEYPDGRIEIEADVFGGSFDAPFSLNYRPPKTDINVETGEPVKYPGDFSVVEQRPKPDYGDPGNFEIDYEVMSVDDTISDLEKLEKIGTGKRIHPKRVEQRTGARKFVEDNPSEDIVNRYGDSEIEYDRMKDEGLFNETE